MRSTTEVPNDTKGFSGSGRATLQATRRGLGAHWRSAVAVMALLTASAGLIGTLGIVGILNLNFIFDKWNTLWGPAAVSLSLTVFSFFLGFAIAMPLGLVRAYGSSRPRPARGQAAEQLSFARARELFGTSKALRKVGGRKIRRVLLAPAYGLVTGYVEGIRGTPFYVQMWLVFFFVTFTWPNLPQLYYLAGLLGLTLNTIGYQAEVLRAGFQSVGQGQVEAAKSIGMRGTQIFAHVTLPQSLRLVILPLTNEWIALFKASSILSFIAVQELMFQSKNLGSNLGHPLEAFVMVAVMYLIINIPLGRLVAYVERKKRIPGLGVPLPEATRGRVRVRPVRARV